MMLLLRNCGWRKKLVSSLEEKFSTDETCWVIIANKFEISVNACYTTYHVFNCWKCLPDSTVASPLQLG